MKQDNRITLKINDRQYKVGFEIPLGTTLNEYIRNYANLKGTKFMCLEGGCGACIVSVKKVHPVRLKDVIFSVNSCLVPIFSCDGWDITVIEGIGNRTEGYHKLQTTLAAFNGTQCGFCTPGWIMNMYSLLESKGHITMQEVEDSFGGNICRCTGYRPIMDAFKSLAIDAPSSLKEKCPDIEDLTKGVICRNTGKVCENSCNGKYGGVCSVASLHLVFSDVSAEWYQVSTLKEIFQIYDTITDLDTYMLVGGFTSHGVYRIQSIRYYISVNNVAELQACTVSDDSVVLGANTTLSDAIVFLKTSASEHTDKFGYLEKIARHIELIANVPVRNIGTLAGNLSIKHAHNEFPSDLFLILEAVSAQLTIGDVSGTMRVYRIREYLQMNMRRKIIVNIILPSYHSASYVFTSYKIMQRAQNTHAYVNAAFLLKVDKSQQFKILEKPSLVFGGINSSFIHASNTEDILTGQSILNPDVLKRACSSLFAEIQPDEHPPETAASYRQLLSVSLFYKFVLSLSPEHVSDRYKTGGTLLERPLSSGKHDFETDKSKWPLTKPVSKVEALIQCAGEAEYVADIHVRPGELYASFVTSDRGPGEIISIDASEALAMAGVRTFLAAKDIPGVNSFVEAFKVDDEELFADKEVKFSGQPVGVIVAESQRIANKAAEKVKVNVASNDHLYLNAKHVVDDNVQWRIKLDSENAAKKRKNDDSSTGLEISGEFIAGGQYHFTMETQTCYCVPTEDGGMDVYPSSQWITGVNINVAAVLSLPQNTINVMVRRLGGGYGAKLTRSTLIATACAVAAYNMKCPVRMVASLETNMRAFGKRFPIYTKYQINVNEKGAITQLDANVYSDVGHSLNDKLGDSIITNMQQLYDNSTWNLKEYAVITDCASHTYARSPGTTEGIATIEYIMEHIAAVTGQDPIDVRLANLKPKQNDIQGLIIDLKKTSDFDKREQAIDLYNQENRWKKKGISIVPMSYPYSFDGTYHILLSVFAPDGTVAITHGGIEMGQGINTKLTQVVAYTLGIDMKYIKIKTSNSLTAPNDAMSGGSLTSDGVCYAAVQCCNMLLDRLKPIKGRSRNMNWEQLINAAYGKDVDLCCEYMYAASKATDVEDYPIYGVTAVEVEIDVLTGQLQILRVDILEDVGQSMSPEVDIGQVEGAFVMGLGYWLTEKLVYDQSTGKLLTDRTWNYTPPGAKDIPIDFRVYFRRNAPNPFYILRSKATGEPPLCMSICVVFAIRNALQSARKDAGCKNSWFDISLPCTPESIQLSSMTSVDQFGL